MVRRRPYADQQPDHNWSRDDVTASRTDNSFPSGTDQFAGLDIDAGAVDQFHVDSGGANDRGNSYVDIDPGAGRRPRSIRAFEVMVNRFNQFGMRMIDGDGSGGGDGPIILGPPILIDEPAPTSTPPMPREPMNPPIVEPIILSPPVLINVPVPTPSPIPMTSTSANRSSDRAIILSPAVPVNLPVSTSTPNATGVIHADPSTSPPNPANPAGGSDLPVISATPAATSTTAAPSLSNFTLSPGLAIAAVVVVGLIIMLKE
jgi:hypothetical protein